MHHTLSVKPHERYIAYKQDLSPKTSDLRRNLLKSLPEHRGYWLAA
jgi:hypothetical protein